MPEYNHMFDYIIAFEVISEKEDASDITLEQLHLGLRKRLLSLAESNEYDMGLDSTIDDFVLCNTIAKLIAKILDT
jgi:hypothetical protein